MYVYMNVYIYILYVYIYYIINIICIYYNVIRSDKLNLEASLRKDQEDKI